METIFGKYLGPKTSSSLLAHLQLYRLLDPSFLEELPRSPGDASDDQLREVLRIVFGHKDFRGRQVGEWKPLARGWIEEG